GHLGRLRKISLNAAPSCGVSASSSHVIALRSSFDCSKTSASLSPPIVSYPCMPSFADVDTSIGIVIVHRVFEVATSVAPRIVYPYAKLIIADKFYRWGYRLPL